MILSTCLYLMACAQVEPMKDWKGETPEVIAGIAAAYMDRYDVVLRPDEDAAEWWAGAPSVVHAADGVFWMACRMRTPNAPRGLRGYEVRILRSEDGVHFEKALSMKREDLPIPGFERPALVQDPKSGRFKLYLCGPWKDGPWCILKLDDADTPTAFDPKTARPVIQPIPPAYERDVVPENYKDPVVFSDGRQWHCWVIGYIRKNEKIFHFTSSDGEAWAPVGDPYTSVLPLSGWHDFFVRPASVLPLGFGYLFFYEGSHTSWYDPVYNVLTGVGMSFDLNQVMDMTPDKPLFASTTPGAYFKTWRYSSWLLMPGEIWAYAEVACPNDSKETRLYRFPMK